MNHDKENKASNRTLAVGWFDNAPFRTICGKYVSRIKEVFFAWPGVTASRPMAEWTPERVPEGSELIDTVGLIQ